MEKKMVILLSMLFVLIISAASVRSQLGPGDCLDGCSTGCVAYVSDSRRQARCDRKCQILCSPEYKANKQIKSDLLVN